MNEGRLVSARRKEIAAWAVKNFKAWPKPHEEPDADPESIGCELVVLAPRSLPVLRCRFGGGYVDSLTWFYARRGKSTPNALAQGPGGSSPGPAGATGSTATGTERQ